MSIRAIIWDMEGVILLNSHDNVPASIAKRLDVPLERLLSTDYDREFTEHVDRGEYTQDDAWDHMLDKLDLPRSNKITLERFFREDFYIDQDLVADIRAYHKHFKTALLSNYSNTLRPMLSGPWRMDGAFDEVFISYELKMVKPEAAIYQYALDKLGVTPQETIFIDDRPVNVEGAATLGIHAFQFLDRVDMNNRIQEIITRVK
jgi:putative hydrolase of the HAD superfamily